MSIEKTEIKQTEKVEVDACCCTGSGSWCKFFFERKNVSTTVSQQHTSVADKEVKNDRLCG